MSFCSSSRKLLFFTNSECYIVSPYVLVQHLLQIPNVHPIVPCTQGHNNQVGITVLDHTGDASPDPLGELHVLGHDRHPLGVDGAEHGVLEQGGEVGLGRLLKSQDGNSLEPAAGFKVLLTGVRPHLTSTEGSQYHDNINICQNVSPEILHAVACHVDAHLPHQSRERKLWDEEVGRLLILPDLPQGSHAPPACPPRPVSHRCWLFPSVLLFVSSPVSLLLAFALVSHESRGVGGGRRVLNFPPPTASLTASTSACHFTRLFPKC